MRHCCAYLFDYLIVDISLGVRRGVVVFCLLYVGDVGFFLFSVCLVLLGFDGGGYFWFLVSLFLWGGWRRGWGRVLRCW